MSHTAQLKPGAYILRNGDWSGDVEIHADKNLYPVEEPCRKYREHGEEFIVWRIPAALIVAIRQEALRAVRESAIEMMKRPDDEFVTREEAAQELERLAAVIRNGDPEARVYFRVQLTFRHIRKVPDEPATAP